MPRDRNARVTPEEIVGLILDEMQRSVTPSWYTDYVNCVYRVYLYREDLDELAALQPRIREQASRALDEELAKLNKPVRSLPLVRAPRKKRYEPLGNWMIEFLENSDEDAARNRVIVKSSAPTAPSSESLEGPPTVRVNAPPPSSGDDSATRRTSSFGPTPGDNVVHARLSYQDDTGEHTYEMTKDRIKIGRGGPNEWVDIRLLTKVDVSREHLQIRRDGSTGKFLIKDMSMLGTWVNGTQITPSVVREKGVLTDRNIETEMPTKSRLNLANVVFIEFRKVR
jgi:pSer/pThr/pTyr-binding forkhead associated (FHA) protein